MSSTVPFRMKREAPPTGRHRRHEQKPTTEPWWAVEEDGSPAMMLCGIHKRPKSHPALEDAVGDSRRYRGASRAHMKYRRTLERGEKHGSCLCDYTYYPELLKEREMADQTITPQFPLMKLPAELRLNVYRQMLVSPGGLGIEFCPVPYVRAPTHSYSGKERWFESTVKASDYQREIRSKTIGQYAGILRVNKEVHADALRILYSENEYRFTNQTGWLGLDAFLYNIDIPNCSLLRSITVRHSDLLDLPRTCATASTFWDGMHVRHDPGERFRRERWYDAPEFDLKGLLSDAASCLQRIGKLKHLCIIVDKYGDGVFKCPVDETKFDNITITWTSLGLPEPKIRVPDYFHHTEQRREAANVGEKFWAQRTVEAAEKPEWRWQWLEADEYGCYAGIHAKSMSGKVEEQQAEAADGE